MTFKFMTLIKCDLMNKKKIEYNVFIKEENAYTIDNGT